MNLHHLELFHSIATHGNMTAAARESFTSQPAVSKQIRTFEDSLGTRLFDRLPRGTRLTEAGELLAGHAREIFARRDLALRQLKELSELRRGRLALATSRTIGAYLLPEPLARFASLHVGIEIEAHVFNTRQCVDMVLRGEVEAALVEGPTDRDDVLRIPFASDELVVVASPSHPLARRRGRIALERIAKERLIAREPGSGTRDILDRELARLGIRWRPFLELGSPEAIKGLAVAGTGVAVVSRLAVDREVRAQTLKILRIEGASFTRELSLVRMPGTAPTKALEAFLAILSETSK